MMRNLPAPVPEWNKRGERSFAYPYTVWRTPRAWCLAVFTNRHDDTLRREIIGLGSVFPGHHSETYERSLLVRHYTPLQRPLALRELVEPMGASSRYLDDDGRLSPKAGEALVQGIRSLRPEIGQRITELEQILDAAPPEGPVGERLAFEKDAVGTLLDITGMDRDVIEEWQAPVGSATPSVPFLEGLPNLRIIEDQQIVHDHHRFPGMDGSDALQLGWRVYTPSGDTSFPRQQLFVYNANRSQLEHDMGLDLLYYNEPCHSLVMVQYKRMRQENSGWVYRRDGSLDKELERMREVDAFCQGAETSADPRLVATPSVVKLCRTTPFAMNSTKLIPGMYLTRPHFEEILHHPDAIGPNNGIRIREGDVPRYLNNTTFATLVRGGWMGSRGTSTDYLIEQIRQSLSPDGPGSVVVGVHRSVDPPGNRRRDRW